MSLFKFQAIFREYLLINKKSPCSKEFFLNSSWPKPNFLPGLKYFLAQHSVETQICTLSKIFWVKKSTLKVGTPPYDRKPKSSPGTGWAYSSVDFPSRIFVQNTKVKKLGKIKDLIFSIYYFTWFHLSVTQTNWNRSLRICW